MRRRIVAAVGLLVAAIGVVGAQAFGPVSLPDGTVVVQEQAGQLLRSENGGVTWNPVPGLPERVLPEYRAGETLPVSAIAVQHPGRDRAELRAALASSASLKQSGFYVSFPGDRVLVAAGRTLLISTDGLLSWREIELDDTVNRATYITALAIDPSDPDHWLVGTSYDGLFQTRDAGTSWHDLTTERQLWPTYQGAGFFDEIEDLWFSPFGELYVRIGFGGGYLRVTFDPLSIQRLSALADETAGYAAITAGVGMPGFRPPYRTALWRGDAAPSHEDVASEKRAERAATAAGRTGIYLSARNAASDRLDEYFALMERFGYDKLVVDFKDDAGRVTYASAVPLAQEIGAVVPIIDPPELLRRAHERGFYVAARVVVFKDPRLFAFDSSRYAYWDVVRNIPWGRYRAVADAEGNERTVNIEPWVDAYATDVHEYVVALALEMEALGVDEIQFDYIRFPSDGPVENIQSRFRPEGADRVQALETFLSRARREIGIPISIDVFGFNAWARMSYLGQDISRLSAYVDVISPMSYPSHYARSFLPGFSYLDRALEIYRSGSYRAQVMAGEQTIIRPYVQAFLIGSELEFERPTFERYLELQIAGLEASPASGYTLWNASNRYYMLPQ